MKYSMDVFDCLCAMRVFTINDIKAYETDFGEGYDESREEAEPYCCGNYRWRRKPSCKEVLDKHRISEEEYNEIAEILEDTLSFGHCCWCS